MVPLLAVPHLAIAVGLAFLIAPSGWLIRLISPWATGWHTPPDFPLVQDPLGLALAFALVLKETPFLILMTFGALGQIGADAQFRMARSLGYGPVQAWLKVILPQVYPQIRLPVYAVLAYALSVVDMAIVLGPTTPPTLATLVLRWFYDPDLATRFQAAAGRGPAARRGGPGDRAVARPRGGGRPSRAALAGPRRPWRPRRRAAPCGMGQCGRPVRVRVRLPARPGPMVDRAPLALSGRLARQLVARGLVGSPCGAGRADLDDAGGRRDRHRGRDRSGRRLSRERGPTPAAAGPGRARPDLRAPAGAADRLSVRGPGAVPLARARRRLARVDLDPPPVRSALRVFDPGRSVPQSRSALRPQRAGARQAARGSSGFGSS